MFTLAFARLNFYTDCLPMLLTTGFSFLGMGTLAGHYCNEHNCENLDELNKLMDKMTSKLTSNPGSHKEESTVIAMLKGLANIHHLSDSILDKLASMATDKKAPSRLRAAVFETFLADPCKAKVSLMK